MCIYIFIFVFQICVCVCGCVCVCRTSVLSTSYTFFDSVRCFNTCSSTSKALPKTSHTLECYILLLGLSAVYHSPHSSPYMSICSNTVSNNAFPPWMTHVLLQRGPQPHTSSLSVWGPTRDFSKGINLQLACPPFSGIHCRVSPVFSSDALALFHNPPGHIHGSVTDYQYHHALMTCSWPCAHQRKGTRDGSKCAVSRYHLAASVKQRCHMWLKDSACPSQTSYTKLWVGAPTKR